ncbi:hypothetical protein K469DRAFT_739271 [Zopfia rhizophila CBS 207.26]|uniref:Rhodopsin domain-containing protein n=1 Tax=Zopfia rhizophila CBS 207.26 TaxID=1314779 RepID=A0A6A6E3Z8_9PEZI|nr:hypothetical protein K469DRAFT_739271 [Zopfia rhizophila CBS 207.26]
MELIETSSPSTLQAVIIFLTVLACIAIALRLYTRNVLGQNIKIDDWFSLIGFVSIGKHYVGYPVPEDWSGEEELPLLTNSLQHYYILYLLLFPTLWFIKCSVVLFYHRVLVADKKNYTDWANILVLSSLALVTVWSLAFGLAWVFVCNPVKGFWSYPYAEDEGPCGDTWLLNRWISISDFVVDVLVILVPVPLVWRLHLPTSRKFAVLIVFFLGTVAVAASVMRMARVLWASSPQEEDIDGLLVNTTVLFWSMIEINLALLAACLPTLRGLLKARTMDSLMKSVSSITWLKSTRGSSRSRSTGEHDVLPLTNSPMFPEKRKGSGGRDKYSADITLATLDSVTTSNMTQLR